jgi:ribosomal protein S14
MISKKIRDIKLRKEFQKKEFYNLSFKFIYTNFLNKYKQLPKFEQYISLQKKNFSKTKLVRRCILNNRSRGSIRPFNISRIKLRELFQFGLIPGYKKSVW